MKKKSTQFRWLVTMLMLVTAMVMPSTSLAQSSYTDDFVGGRTDFRDEAIYSVLTTRFYDGDKSNNAYCWDHSTANNGMDAEWRGDFKGLIEKLDYIKALGFTAVWISPVAENASGFDYHGYHPFDFTKEDARLQSKANAVLGIAEDVTFKTLVDEAHKRGMKIILDIVLNSTSNFGEKNLGQLFRKDYNSIYEGDFNSAIIPVTVNDTDDNGNPGKLEEEYLSLTPGEQYKARLDYLKNTDNVNHDSHNYWHHEGDLSWESFTVQTGQKAGDDVDLNTENPAVYKYLRESYGRFIEMGVDGFRIDDVKHISRLTFNKAFLPYFHEMGEQYKSKRLNECPFFIYGEVCTRVTEVTNKNIPAISSYFYTWQSPESLTTQWDDDATFWDNKVIYRNTDITKMGNIGLTYQEYTQAGSESDQPTSNNALLNGNEYHAPDVSKASGMNVIDFPMHWSFGKATNAFGIAKSGDRLYNDATYNVVYVDSYDYGPDSDVRYNAGTAAWAENLNLMFTFRGIPCLLYGSEIEFRKDCYMDKGPNAPLKETGRAYYGGYITGDVNATGFGSYSDANGNVAATLSKPLARHIARLSQIRQQVPALRKGQYSTEGCEGAIAFKRRYTNGDIDSYALVAISGAATFTGVLNGEYTEVITGAKVTVSDGTLSSPEITKGNMRVYVLNGTSKIGEDGQYLFDTTANYSSVQIYDGHQEDDCAEKPEDCRLKFSPEAGLFDGETLEVTITPTSKVVSAWYKVGKDGTRTDITIGTETKITIGEGIESGDIVIYYGCTGVTGTETTRSVTYFKTGNEAPSGPEITIYVKGAEAQNIYAWVEDESGSSKLTESWPGTKMTESTTINGENFWYYTISGYSSFNYIINDGSNQTGNLSADGDRYHDENRNDITDQMTPAYTDITLAANSGSTDYWGTYSNMSSAARLSTVDGTSLKVYDAKVSGGALTLTERTGSDVAKGEGVLVWSNGATVRATVINDNLNASANTDLVATPATEQTISAGDGYTLYRLTYNNVSTKEGLGFYLGLVKDAEGTVISDGSKLKATPNKAYLKVTTEAATKPSNAAPARGFAFPGDDETTGIGEIVIEGDAGISGSANADGRIYNLQGQQVTAPVKGLYIKNNKKVIIK